MPEYGIPLSVLRLQCYGCTSMQIEPPQLFNLDANPRPVREKMFKMSNNYYLFIYLILFISFLVVPGASTKELAACYNVSVDCRAGDMIATVRTSKIFQGKLYAKGKCAHILYSSYIKTVSMYISGIIKS